MLCATRRALVFQLEFLSAIQWKGYMTEGYLLEFYLWRRQGKAKGENEERKLYSRSS